MQSETVTMTRWQVDLDSQSEPGNSTVRSDVSVASSGYCFVGPRIKDRKTIPDYLPEEPPPDYDAPQISIDDVQKTTQEPLLQSARQISQSESSGSMVVSITGASPTQHISFQISDGQLSPRMVKERDPFLRNNSQIEPSRGSFCTQCSRREKILVVFVILAVILLVVVILNFTVCLWDFTSACH